MDYLARLADALWNPWLLGLFLLTGLVYSAGSGFFQIFECRTWWRATVGSLFQRRGQKTGGLSPLQALATALASTMGTGSIAGVAAALTLGGPGAVFWMWVSALLGMMTGCGEKLLAVKYQRPGPDGQLRGGPMYYLRDGLGSPFLSACFCLACIPATLAGGNLIQSSSIASSLEAAFGLPRLLAGVVTALLAGLIMAGGLGRIAAAASALVPTMAMLYLGSGCAVLLYHWERVPEALGLICSCALSPSAAAAGGAGWTLSAALRCGVARGVFTNEAGLGTSAMAHGAARVDHPARQGMWGIFEVFLSTLLVCTVTALAILVSGVWTPASPDALTGAPLTAAAFGSVLGPFGQGAVALSLLLFAFSSILGWSFYGQQCLEFLSGQKLLAVYRAVFLLCTLAGAVWNPQVIWQLVDLCNALMALPNLIALLFLAPQALSLLSGWKRQLQTQGGKNFKVQKMEKTIDS
ncbi:alanine/glycine:cation symporter family protein [Flintibacter muris]|uniref:alanine/glycine:cation symporter family protein n=1 Tax=Flintibacter muris TaxID=2941327 RepID=UPI00203BED7D|nr:sodium:alanine symporter family protein [Flintibacter muris]